jgi:NAD-dependent deacetylase
MQLPTGLLKPSSKVAVLTGAGVSAESGIPTFRSNGGYWQQHRFEDLATPQGFARDPKFVWTWPANGFVPRTASRC